MEALDIQDRGLDEALGLRPHTDKASKPKSKFAPHQTTTTVIDANDREKSKVVFIPFLDIMHRILRNSLFPRVGNLDMVHSYLVDMLILCMK